MIWSSSFEKNIFTGSHFVQKFGTCKKTASFWVNILKILTGLKRLHNIFYNSFDSMLAKYDPLEFDLVVDCTNNFLVFAQSVYFVQNVRRKSCVLPRSSFLQFLFWTGNVSLVAGWRNSLYFKCPNLAKLQNKNEYFLTKFENFGKLNLFFSRW